jgi:hypothetical protein
VPGRTQRQCRTRWTKLVGINDEAANLQFESEANILAVKEEATLPPSVTELSSEQPYLAQDEVSMESKSALTTTPVESGSANLFDYDDSDAFDDEDDDEL